MNDYEIKFRIKDTVFTDVLKDCHNMNELSRIFQEHIRNITVIESIERVD